MACHCVVSLLPDVRFVTLQVYGDGFCFNSETHNKEPSSGVCDNKPVSTSNVMGYQFATLDALLGM